MTALMARRRAQRADLLRLAGNYVVALNPRLEVVAAIVFGSVARGDFNSASDVDVLIVAGGLPARYLDRLEMLGRPPPGVEPIVWTPAEWRRHLVRRNRITLDALEHGVWVHGTAADLNINVDGPRG